MSKADVIYGKVRVLPEPAQAAVLKMVEMLADAPGPNSTKQPPPSSRLATQFRELAEQWRRETGYFSFMHQRALHPAYQRIIGMGWAVVPLLLQELQKTPDHWLWALQAITGEEPAQGTNTVSAAAAAWVRWGKERGLLDNGKE